jgi:CubicO group peptidase (beta-lactamase class C family)
MKRQLLYFSIFLSLIEVKAQDLYFPPLSGSMQWDTISPADMGWCTSKIAALYNFLQQENTKGFIVLKDGKIALEKYFGTFTKDSIWYWASAGKTITSFLVGQAQEDGYLSIMDTSSEYLGVGWTNCAPGQEEKITIRNQLTMTSGLDDGVPDNHCILDTCLNYLADAGNRWAYHNAPYTLLEKVLETSTGQQINTYTQLKLKAQTGMTGFWLTIDYDNVFFSIARSMARFGLLFQNRCIWDTDTLLHDTAYIHQMTNTSQSLNNSYGYLWWLNGKASYMLPGLQIVIPGSYAPQAPVDMFAALGKNGQILSISPGKGIVFVRMGNQPNSPMSEVPNLFCNEIWEKLNEIMCNSNSVSENLSEITGIKIYPNPVNDKTEIFLEGAPSKSEKTFILFDYLGKEIFKKEFMGNCFEFFRSGISSGIYFFRIKGNNLFASGKLVIK